MLDTFQRPLHDLRLSVIDRCNFRCGYCMPKDKSVSFMPKKEWLNFSQIKRVVRAFTSLGVDKVRLTGGEPLLRPGIPQLIAELRQIKAIKDLALTTNGSLLKKEASALKAAGLNRLTVSLDTLDRDKFTHLNGTSFNPDDVLEAIFHARDIGFKDIKINTVLQKGKNEEDILPIIETFRGTGIIVRFIEYMDVGTRNQWSPDQVLSSAEILKRIQKKYPLKPLSPNYVGEVAERYRYTDEEGEIGFVSSVTQPFCQDCSRARLSADGHLYTCLFAEKGFALKPVLQKSDSELENHIKQIWTKRTDRYSEDRFLEKKKTPRNKVEMFHIGG